MRDPKQLNTMLSQLWESESNTTTFDQSWTQGRSAFGGLAAAFAVCGMRKQLPAHQPMRSLMVSFIAPIPAGEVSVDVEIQRQGKNVTQQSASVMVDGEIGLQAMGVFGNPRDALQVPTQSEFNAQPKEAGIPFDVETRRVPEFLSYFEGFWLPGAIPFSGEPERKLAMWVKHRQPIEDFPVERIIALADIPPPVILSFFEKGPVPASSLTWSLEFMVPAEEVTSEWLYLEFEVEAAAEGYTQQSGRLFDENGQLCALSRQCMVYFG